MTPITFVNFVNCDVLIFYTNKNFVKKLAITDNTIIRV